MKYFIGTPEQVFKNHEIHEELSRALHQTNSKPDYDNQIMYIYDDNDNLIQTIQIGHNKFLDTRMWFYLELHRLQDTYVHWDNHRSFPVLERLLKDKLLK